MIVDLVYTIILAFVFHILIESPFNNFLNHLMEKKVETKDIQSPKSDQVPNGSKEGVV